MLCVNIQYLVVSRVAYLHIDIFHDFQNSLQYLVRAQIDPSMYCSVHPLPWDSITALLAVPTVFFFSI